MNIIDPNHPTRSEHEFDDEQNAVFKGLGGSMTFVGIALLIFGIIKAIYGVMSLSSPLDGIVGIATGVCLVLIGAWLMSAATRFRDIVSTQGSDLTHLMAAIKKLTNVYVLQAWMIGIQIALMIIVFTIAIMALAGNRSHL